MSSTEERATGSDQDRKIVHLLFARIIFLLSLFLPSGMLYSSLVCVLFRGGQFDRLTIAVLDEVRGGGGRRGVSYGVGMLFVDSMQTRWETGRRRMRPHPDRGGMGTTSTGWEERLIGFPFFRAVTAQDNGPQFTIAGETLQIFAIIIGHTFPKLTKQMT